MIPVIPTTLDEWNIEILNELVNYKDIESETFDFKGVKLNQLHEHLCAMANTNGGLIVLGIDEVKGKDGETLLRFKKTGFKQGKEDYVSHGVGNNVYNIDPTPKVTSTNIYDNDSRFYTVLKIEHETFKKPYFIKGSNQCYVRIGSSSRPAGRSTILHLFSNFVERKASVERLKVVTLQLKEELSFVSESLRIAGSESGVTIAPLDLSFIRHAMVSSEWFLAENNLLGGYTGRGSFYTGLYSVLHDLSSLNAQIDRYNRADVDVTRARLASYFQTWQPGYGSITHTIKFLDNIINTCGEFLTKYRD